METTGKRSSIFFQNLLFLLLPYIFLSIELYLVTGDSQLTPYIPRENIIIDCGSLRDDESLDKRLWVADGNGNGNGNGNGKFTLFEHQSNNNTKSSVLRSTTSQQLPSSVEKVPYYTARLSYSEFTYSFPLSAGQKFIRLHFYPTSYPGFDDPSTRAFFSVKAGPFTLLKNFSALLHAGRQLNLVKEFCVNVNESERLNITFTPSPDISDSFAFINGIEIISMPTNLYYRPVNDEGITFLGQGQGNLYPLGNSSALENLHRVNVGGKQLSPSEDTGMFRSWSEDTDYLTVAKPSALPVKNGGPNLTFPNDIPPYSAPTKVYETARSMGTNKTVNEHYNLTWEFTVDSGFNYFVRLHFCEFQREVTQQGDRVFEIFLANLTAETQADVIVWSGGNRFPVYKDYVVGIGRKGNQKQQNLSVALHPAPGWRTLYSDAILNGLEIFKLSNNFDLSSPNPDPIPTSPSGNSQPSSTKPKNTNNTTIGIVGGVIAGFVVLSLICFLIFRRKGKLKDSGSSYGISMWSRLSAKSTKFRGSSLPSDLCRYFPLDEIKGATNNFNDVFIIGVGGFGNVYKGFIDGGTTQVAIKRLNPESRQGAHEFKTEIEMLSQLRYLHLVSLIGYCNDGGEMILVYDYMSRGTLRDHLYNTTENPPLPWRTRLEICIGAARGLYYLHSGAKQTVIHRDVKTTNILLDEKWVAKVSDFGLSKIGPTNMSDGAHVSTVVKGSFGYLDPEYYRRQQLTEKSDVYSFGVVLCEVLCARPPINRTVEKKLQVSLATWVQECHKNGTLYEIIDPFLKGKIVPECFQKFTDVATSCLFDEGIRRPSMGDIVWSLEFALQLQESGEEALKPNATADGIDVDIEEEAHLININIGLLECDSGEMFSRIGDHVLNSKSTTSSFSFTTSDEHSSVSKDSDRVVSQDKGSVLR